MRKFAIASLVLVVAAIGVVLTLPSVVDWNRYREEIAAAAGDLTGRRVVIDGAIRFRLLPEPILALDGLRLSDDRGVSIAVRSVRARVELLPLLLGRVEVGRLTLVAPEVDVVLGAAGHPPAAATTGPLARLTPGTAFQVIEVEGGRLRVADPRDHSSWTVGDIEGEGTARSLDGPFSARGRAVIDGIEVDFTLNVARLRPDGTVAIPRLRVGIVRAGAKLSFSGSLRPHEGGRSLQGSISLEAPNLARLGEALGGEGPAPLPHGPLALTARVEGQGRELALDDINLSLAGARFSGALSVVIGRPLRFDLALEANRIDLDAMLPRAQWNWTEAVRMVSGAVAWAPRRLFGRIDLDLGGLTYRGGVLRQTRISAICAEGVMRVEKIATLLPGGSRFEFTGVAREMERPGRLQGRIALNSDNLSRFLDWLGFDVAAIPSGRLAGLSLTGEAKVDGDLLQFADILARFDDSRLEGEITYLIQQRPVFGAALSLDRLDLDSYVQPAAIAGRSGLARAPPADTLRPLLARLEDFDANLQLAVGELTLAGLPLERIELDVGLRQGRMTMRRARIGALAGASVAFTATAGGFATAPKLKARFQAASDDLSELAHRLAIPDASAAKELGRASVEGDLELDFERVGFEAAVTVLGLRTTLDGRIDHARDDLPIELRLEAEHADVGEFATALGWSLSPLAGALAGSATVSGQSPRADARRAARGGGRASRDSGPDRKADHGAPAESRRPLEP